MGDVADAEVVAGADEGEVVELALRGVGVVGVPEGRGGGVVLVVVVRGRGEGVGQAGRAGLRAV